MQLYKLHILAHPPELPNGPATYTLMIAREASPRGSVQSANFPSWTHLRRNWRKRRWWVRVNFRRPKGNWM